MYIQFDDIKSQVMAFGFWASADGRGDNPNDDKAFVALMDKTACEEYRDLFEEYYRLGHFEERQLHKDRGTIYFSDTKYIKLKGLMDIARNLGQMAAFSFISPEFACNDPRFVDLVSDIDDPTWEKVLTFEWSYGYDESLDAINSGSLEAFKSSAEVEKELHRFSEIRKRQRLAKRHKNRKIRHT